MTCLASTQALFSCLCWLIDCLFVYHHILIMGSFLRSSSSVTFAQWAGAESKWAKNSSLATTTYLTFLSLFGNRVLSTIYSKSVSTLVYFESCYFFKIKRYVPIAFSSPRAQPEVVLFWVSNESPYFSHYNPKISASNSIYFWSLSIAENVPISPDFDFLMHFHNSLIPSVTFLILPQERK